MPGKIKVKVLAGRNLPVMDRAGDTTDAFVEIKFGGVTHKTDVCRKSLNPHWNSTEWYRFEVDESELQDEPLQLRLMDHDTYSANDAIGKVVISLAPLLAREANNVKATTTQHGGAVMSGWIPVFDTMHGIRGELNIIVKVELFSDFNKYKTSSCGVQFFHCPMIPPGYRATAIHGFVEELVVNDDPEYQWIDKIRTPRASNEARQVAFINLSNQVQRLVGLKAAELGANAVVGYQQELDLEGEAGVVARAIGTAVCISPVPLSSQPVNVPPCTQQQLKKYLDILATDDESITDLNQYYQTHQEELQKLLTILNPKTPSLLDETDNADDDEKSLLTRQSSIQSYAGNVSLYQDEYVSQQSLRHIADDQTDLNRLLNRVDDNHGPTSTLKKIKKFKTNFFLKRLGSIRSKRAEQQQQDDQISLKSNSSDTSRISLVDIKNEITKLRRLKKPKFHKTFTNPHDEGIGMASILARSVIHAHTSLACIAETQDAEQSPSSTLRRTSESEPVINMSEENKTKMITLNSSFDTSVSQSDTQTIPEIRFTSLKNINSDDGEKLPARQRKLSESCPSSPIACRNDNLLKLPGETGYFGSVSSALSGDSSDMYSSSDDEDESSDPRTDTERSIETTSSVVRTVMKHELDSTFMAQMDKKLSALSKVDSQTSINQSDNAEQEKTSIKMSKENERVSVYDAEHIQVQPVERNINNATQRSSEVETNTFVVPKQHHYHFKFHNPFVHKKSQSISAPSSPTESKSFVYRSSKRIRNQISKLSKSSMIKSLSHYSLHPKKKHEEQKYALSQPGSSSDVTSKAPSDTVLGSPFLSYADLLSLDKGLQPNKLHKSDELDRYKEKGLQPNKLHKSDEFDRSKVSMYIGSEPASRASLSGSLYPTERHPRAEHHPSKKVKSCLKPTGLVHTAMETILIDKVQNLLIPTSPEPVTHEKKFFDDVTKKLQKVEQARNNKCESSEKTQSLMPTSTPNSSPTFDKHELKKCYEKSSEVISHKKEDNTKSHTTELETSGLAHTDKETILMDKVQSIFSAPVNYGFTKGDHGNDVQKRTGLVKNVKKEVESSGLLNTAIKTILIDKVQTLVDPDKVVDVISSEEVSSDEAFAKNKKKSTGLTHTGMESLLIEKMHSFFIGKDRKKSMESLKNDNPSVKPSGLVHTAVETMLIDKVQSLLPKNDEENKNVKTMPKLTEKDSISKDRKLVRQNSIHSVSDCEESQKMSTEVVLTTPCKVAHKPVLQHLHPILSGAALETIPSLPESSFDRTESLDVEGLASCNCLCNMCGSINTNKASVCGNSHAACGVCRCERDKDKIEKDKGSPRHARHESYGGREPVVTTAQPQNSSLNATSTPMGIHRRSSDSDLSITPKGSSLNTSAVNTGSGGGAILRPSMNSNNLELLEYPFLTMTEYPPGFIVHIGGTVCARSVKLIDGGGESAARAAWWAELRTELRAHARALRCNAVIAYTDSAAICEDVCVLSASGTAAVINLDCDFNTEIDASVAAQNGNKTTIEELESETCCIAHVPYSPGAGPYRAELSLCGGCRRARVPAVLLATCSKPNRLVAYPKGVTLTAVAARTRRAPPASEPGARDISDQLPFLEYELHKLLLAKLRMQGANALFNLQTQISIGERCVMALASGTAVRLTALPAPSPPRIKASENDKEALEIQKALWDTFSANKTANGYDVGGLEHSTNGALPEIEGEEPPALDLCADKDACVLELDEAEDVETARTLSTRRMHARMQAYSNALRPIPGAPPYAFTQVWRGKVSASTGATSGGIRCAGERQVGKALDALAYKLRRLQPAALLTTFRLDLPEDEIQLVVSGAAIRLQDPNKPEPVTENGHSQSQSQISNHGNGTGDAEDDIFALDEEQLVKSQHSEPAEDKSIINGQVPTTVALTSLCYISGARIVRRVCALRLIFVRETTTVRELGGLSGFLHTFTCEVLAIVRAYTAALGGNALTSFYITQLMLQDNAHKNQGQCLLSVGGDVVHITY